MTSAASLLYPTASPPPAEALTPAQAALAGDEAPPPPASAARTEPKRTDAARPAAEVAAVQAIEDAKSKPSTDGGGLYEDTPKEYKDVIWEEPKAASTTDYASVLHVPSGVYVDNPEEFALAQDAMLKAGVGVTQAGAAFKMAMDAVRNPHLTTDTEALQSLTLAWGDNADARLADAKAMVAEVSKTWPGFKGFLKQSGLGNHPPFIRMMAEKWARRK